MFNCTALRRFSAKASLKHYNVDIMVIECYYYFTIVSLAEPITVGWGKKETQFHGSAGKEAAKQKRAEVWYFILRKPK